jgi:hypothetical protein
MTMLISTTAKMVALGIDMLALSVVLGATVWFFLIQSPALFKSMGRERFVPLQMRLALLFFKTVTAVLAVMLLATIVRTEALMAWPTITAATAFIAVAINKLVVLPRALRAGGQSIRKDDHTGDAAAVDFVNEGAGMSTKKWHRLVVLFVGLMVFGLVAHGLALVSATSLA